MRFELKEGCWVPELDLVKTLAIFLMILTHVGEVCFSCAWEDKAFCLASGPWQIFDSWSTILAPALFMFSMGVVLNFTHHRDPKQWISRGWKLVLIWFVLKASYSYPLGLRHASGEEGLSVLQFVFRTCLYSDILFFAGTFFVFLGVLRKLRVPYWAIGTLSVAMFCAGQFIHIEPPTMYLQAFMGNFVSTPYTAFPFLHWSIHPLLGFAWGYFLFKARDRDRFYLISLMATLPVLIGIVGWYLLSVSTTGHVPVLNVLSAYIVKPGTLAASFAIFVFLCSAFHYLMLAVEDSFFAKACHFIAVRLTIIYCLQWLIIPNFAVFLPKWSEGYVASPLVMLGMAAAVYAVSIALAEPVRRLLVRLRLLEDKCR